MDREPFDVLFLCTGKPVRAHSGLPIRTLDSMSLKRSLDDIGRTGDATQGA